MWQSSRLSQTVPTFVPSGKTSSTLISLLWRSQIVSRFAFQDNHDER